MDRRLGRSTPALTRDDRFISRLTRALTIHARRLVARLSEYDPPRGAGSATAAAIILAAAGYGTVAGGHLAEIAGELHRACDAVASRAGFAIESVALSGQKELSRRAILSAAGVTADSSLLCLDASATRRALGANPWIADATVLKLYPNQLRLEIKERAPLAVWQKDGRMSLIAADGTVLEDYTGERYTFLPLVVGEGAPDKARDFLALVSRYPLIREQVEASVLVAQRRWNVHLQNGIEVKLPDENVEEALQILVTLDRDKKLLSRDILVVDLRQADRVTVRLSAEAAAARTEAMKPPKKSIRKGGAA
jgi:cell division protein FtsQ